jgi:transposase
VKPYVKTNKSDYIDAEAIAGAVWRPRMGFVPIPSPHPHQESFSRVVSRW